MTRTLILNSWSEF